jgi:putative effector of murein hydrolase LrgA (UPF0299 family)
MLQRLPKLAEIGLFAILALVCAAVVAASPKQDSALFFATVPLFFVCALMGVRRKADLARLQEAEIVEVVETEDVLS